MYKTYKNVQIFVQIFTVKNQICTQNVEKVEKVEKVQKVDKNVRHVDQNVRHVRFLYVLYVLLCLQNDMQISALTPKFTKFN